MYKNSENGAKLPISTKYAVEKQHGGRRTGGTFNARWPVRGAILINGTVPASVEQQWRSLGARCNEWIARLRAP